MLNWQVCLELSRTFLTSWQILDDEDNHAINDIYHAHFRLWGPEMVAARGES